MLFPCYLKHVRGTDVRRYMQPATPHTVITTQSCVIEGSHFYNFEMLDRSFTALVAEHFAGATVTNTEHTRAPLLYFKAVDALLARFHMEYGKVECEKLPPVPWRGTLFCLCY